MASNPKPLITAFKNSPDGGRGLARDLRIRWALEEVAQPYDVKLVTFDEMKKPEYRSMQPFGQIPAYREGDLTLFESGAIILHIAETHAGLLPAEGNARARAIAWMFAALTTVEQPIIERSSSWLLERDKPWYNDRIGLLDDRIRVRLRELATQLNSSDWLEGAFSAADLLMIHVLRRLESSGLLNEFPSVTAYVARGTARPAYQRALAAVRAASSDESNPRS